MASGRPDWYSSVAMHGKHNNDYITLAVDDLGNMLAKMTGLFGTTLKTVAVDTDGVMKANLAVQDLARLMVTTTLGPIKDISLYHAFAETGSYTFPAIVGKGTIIGGFVGEDPDASHKHCSVQLTVDDDELVGISHYYLDRYKMIHDSGFLFRQLVYDDTGFLYYLGFNTGISFESKLEITLNEDVGAGSWNGALYYSLIT